MNWYKIAQSSPAPFLETREKAWAWAKENVDIEVDEESAKNEGDFAKAHLELYLGRAEEYSDRYNTVRKLNAITIYRAIRVKTIKDINWKNIGTHWSFTKEGAGVYGDIPHGLGKNAQDIILTGKTETQYIDWEYCFTSFMYYGEDQWECALDEDSPITVTHINNKPIQKILAKA